MILSTWNICIYYAFKYILHIIFHVVIFQFSFYYFVPGTCPQSWVKSPTELLVLNLCPFPFKNHTLSKIQHHTLNYGHLFTGSCMPKQWTHGDCSFQALKGVCLEMFSQKSHRDLFQKVCTYFGSFWLVFCSTLAYILSLQTWFPLWNKLPCNLP